MNVNTSNQSTSHSGSNEFVAQTSAQTTNTTTENTQADTGFFVSDCALHFFTTETLCP
jgi:hypothetical protein